MGLFRRFKGDPKTAFANMVLADLRDRGVSECSYVEDDFAVAYKRSDGGGGHIYLQNTFADCDGADDDYIRQRIANLVQAVAFPPERPSSWAEAQPNLRGVIRNATFGLGAPDTAKTILSRPWQPFLSEMAVIDTPTAMSYVTEDDLVTWEVSKEEVFAAARANLAERRPSAPAERQIMRFVDTGDSYFVSMLLVEGWLASFALTPQDRPVAFITDTSSLVVVPGATTITPLLEMAEEEYSQAGRSISPQAYTVDADGRVVPYPELAGRDDAVKVHRAATILAGNEYATQKHWLDQRHEAQSVDVFTASCTVMQREDNSLFSYTTWPDGVDTLLPRADFVAMAAEEASFFVEWPMLTEFVSLEPERGLYPVRYRVRQWPDAETVAALRSRAVSP